MVKVRKMITRKNRKEYDEMIEIMNRRYMSEVENYDGEVKKRE